MTLSITQEFKRFLTFGVAEDLIISAKKDTAWVKIGKTIKFSRNAVYIGIALAAIASVGLTFSGFGTLPMIGFTAALVIGFAMTAIALKIMHSQITKFQKI